MSSAAFVSVPKKSTTVRFIPSLIKLAFRTAVEVAPEATERQAAALFFTPRNRRSIEPQVPGIPRVSHTIPFGAATGGAGDELLRAWSWGEGPTVLLAHGWEGDAAQMRAFVAPLVADGFRVVAFDMPAHGGSSGRRVNALGMASAIETVARVLGPVFAVIAHSLGGTATALAASNGLGAKRLVLIAPAAEPVFYLRRAAKMMGLPRENADSMVARIERELGMSLSTIDVRLLAPRMREDLLVMHDPEDKEVPWFHGLGIAEAWPGARLERLLGLGHRRVLRDPHVIAQAVAFVAGTELRRSL